MTSEDKRLIEVDFPLERVSLDSVHEKSVRHGHISTLHIWPARRPLAACRAALIATLLPDPGNPAERKEIWRRLAGEVVETVKTERRNGRTIEKRKRETRGGILHWGQESSSDLDWFREKIRDAYGGRAPKVFDPFAGGGAIPLEAMRLGCETTAADINPVAWFILKCTLDYPHRLAGKTLPLPAFARTDRDFMEAFLKKAKGFKGKALSRHLAALGLDDEHTEQELIDSGSSRDDDLLEADLAWQLRAWGRHVLARVRAGLAIRYPTYAEFQPLATGVQFEPRPLALLPPDDRGETDVGPLNAEFGSAYLKDPRNPRWVAKPTVAYLWARTVRCKGCRATLPLLKTRWLAKTDKKRVLLTLKPKPDKSGVDFGVEVDVPRIGSNAAQVREHDKRLGAGTMSRSGARCPCCTTTIMETEDIRLEGRAGRLGAVLMAVVVSGTKGKEYRPPETSETTAAEVSEAELDEIYGRLPLGLPTEAICAERPSPNARGASGLPRYGLHQWRDVFTDRQLLALGTFAHEVRRLPQSIAPVPQDWWEAVAALSALCLGRLADYSSAICTWHNSGEKLRSTFARFALPMVWDYTEVNPLSETSGNFLGALEWVARVVEHLQEASSSAPEAKVSPRSATGAVADRFDIICTDPPYYDAIPYSDLMDFFHVWLRRALLGVVPDSEAVFCNSLGPKWDRDTNSGELVDQPNRFSGNKAASKQNYEDGMARAFRACFEALKENGRLVVVFANKSPHAWETLAGALIRAGFVVDGSWPIQTEMPNKVAGGARLASSVWLVCRKRLPARAGWDSAVLAEMRENITLRLRAFWDAGIRGPDFVWSATGPALEAFSSHPTVKKADEPDAVMTVSDFLREVRRMVVDYVVGRVLTEDGEVESASGLDDITTYYLLHRGDFSLDEAPAGACILYALSCNLSDRELSDRFHLLSRPGRAASDDLEDEESTGSEDSDAEVGGGGDKVKLLPWTRRKAKWLGHEGPGGRAVPLIDRAHRLMHLWRAGDEAKVNAYIDDNGLGRHALFARLLQALIELSPAGSDERAILESLSNHIAARAGLGPRRQGALGLEPQ